VETKRVLKTQNFWLSVLHSCNVKTQICVTGPRCVNVSGVAWAKPCPQPYTVRCFHRNNFAYCQTSKIESPFLRMPLLLHIENGWLITLQNSEKFIDVGFNFTQYFNYPSINTTNIKNDNI